MDTSETYIKMCDCEEIQRQKPPCGDAWHREFYTYRFSYTDKLEDDELIWLPRQDQLQGMVKPELTDWCKIMLFSDWLYSNKNLLDWSMEQLWLAFVMKEKYNKVFDGNNWIEVK